MPGYTQHGRHETLSCWRQPRVASFTHMILLSTSTTVAASVQRGDIGAAVDADEAVRKGALRRPDATGCALRSRVRQAQHLQVRQPRQPRRRAPARQGRAVRCAISRVGGTDAPQPAGCAAWSLTWPCSRMTPSPHGVRYVANAHSCLWHVASGGTATV